MAMNENKRQLPFLNIGSSLLLVVFLVICLFSFATLTLSTASSNYRFSENIATRKTAYYTASNTSEEVLMALSDSFPASSDASITTSSGTVAVTLDGNKASWGIPVDDFQTLLVSAVFDSENYTITQWKTVATSEWEATQSIHLYQP